MHKKVNFLETCLHNSVDESLDETLRRGGKMHKSTLTNFIFQHAIKLRQFVCLDKKSANAQTYYF